MAKIAIIGTGISGLGAAYLLNRRHEVTVYEKAARIGGHSRTVTVDYDGAAIPVVSGHSGLSTYGGSEGVGWATTRAVVNSSLAVIVLDMLISGAGFFIFPKG